MTTITETILQTGRTKVTTSDYFALSYLSLSLVSYSTESSRADALASIPVVLPTIGSYPEFPGTWQLLWGPQATTDNSNLMFAAAYIDSSSGQPFFAAVVVRGTDTAEATDELALLQQLNQDMNAGLQPKWPYSTPNNPGNARIAQGTLDCLQKKLLPMTDPTTKQTVDNCIAAYVKDNPGMPVVVTGHSLGGCQAAVMATYLASVLPNGTKIVPNTFAAPTPGNPDFATMYGKNFSWCPRWYNNLDLVPMAYANLEDMKQLWNKCGMPPSKQVLAAITLMEKLVSLVTYKQAGQDRQLQGTCMPQPPANAKSPNSQPGGLPYTWLGELQYQHFAQAGYWPQVSASDGVAAFPWPVLPLKKS